MTETDQAAGAGFIEAARALFADARTTGRPIQIEGHGSKHFYGNPFHGGRGAPLLLSTQGYSGIVSYDPTELVVVVRAGTPIESLEAALAERGQMLAFDPPRFESSRGRGTVGGMVATGLSGPRRLAAGSCRDFILGLTVLSADGSLLRYGGTVMKNVAGYDMSRLHTGALGSLGLILDVSLKVLPRPSAQASIRLSLSESAAIDACNRWLAQPLPIVATAWTSSSEAVAAQGDRPGELTIWFAGAQAAVSAASTRFLNHEGLEAARSLPDAEAESFWTSLRDQRLPFFRSEPPAEADPSARLWRLSLPTTTPSLPLAGPLLVEWAGGQRWLWTAESADKVRSMVAAHGGHATLYRMTDSPEAREIGAFTPLAPAIRRLHERIKAELDPDSLLNPGRLYPGL